MKDLELGIIIGFRVELTEKFVGSLFDITRFVAQLTTGSFGELRTGGVGPRFVSLREGQAVDGSGEAVPCEAQRAKHGCLVGRASF